jgi:Flp pilus assembly protein TadD
MGLSYTKLSRFKEAVEVCKKAIEIEPDKNEAYNNMGFAMAFLKAPIAFSNSLNPA